MDDNSPPVLQRQGQLATLRLNRPRYHNRIEPDDLIALQDIFHGVETDGTFRVLILTASGPSFSSGYHLGDLKTQAAAPREPSAEPTPFARVADQLENLRVPTVCALNGSVYGGATDLALACDFRIGVEGMKLRMPAAQLGIHYYAGGLRRYVERLGLGAAKKLFLTAAPLKADELLRIGYLDEVVASDMLLARATELAALLADNAPLAVGGMKRSLNQIARGTASDRALNRAYAASVLSEDAREGVDAWHERRKPRFQGR